MSFVFGYLVSMRYLLLGYLRRCICVANRIAFRDPAQLVLHKRRNANEELIRTRCVAPKS